MYKQISRNKRRTWLLLTIFIAIIAGIAAAFMFANNDVKQFYFIFGFGLLYTIIQYFAANAMIISMSGARQVDRTTNTRLYNAVENLAITAGLPMPKVYLIDDPSPNAFASGRKPEKAIVAVTSGLLKMMNDRELNGVLAHEISHIRNYDIRISLLVFALTVLIATLSDIILRIGFRPRRNKDNSPIGMILLLVVAIVAPLIATLTRLAISRKREFLADASAMDLTRDADGLADALAKIAGDKTKMRHVHSSMANMYINNKTNSNFFSKMLATHPPIEKRIEILRKMQSNF